MGHLLLQWRAWIVACGGSAGTIVTGAASASGTKIWAPKQMNRSLPTNQCPTARRALNQEINIDIDEAAETNIRIFYRQWMRKKNVWRANIHISLHFLFWFGTPKQYITRFSADVLGDYTINKLDHLRSRKPVHFLQRQPLVWMLPSQRVGDNSHQLLTKERCKRNWYWKEWRTFSSSSCATASAAFTTSSKKHWIAVPEKMVSPIKI